LAGFLYDLMITQKWLTFIRPPCTVTTWALCQRPGSGQPGRQHLCMFRTRKPQCI